MQKEEEEEVKIIHAANHHVLKAC